MEHPLKSLRLTFGMQMNSVDEQEVCVILTVPPSFLPDSSRSDVCVPTFLNVSLRPCWLKELRIYQIFKKIIFQRTITHVGTLEVNFLGENSTCKVGSPLKLNIRSNEDFYLSKVEKGKIYLRLLYSSYILFAVAVALICLSSFRTKGYTSVTQSDRVSI